MNKLSIANTTTVVLLVGMVIVAIFGYLVGDTAIVIVAMAGLLITAIFLTRSREDEPQTDSQSKKAE